MRYVICFILFSVGLIATPPKIIVFDYGGLVADVERRPLIEFLSDSLEIPYRKVKKDFSSEKLYKAFEKPNGFWELYAEKTLPKAWFETLSQHKHQIVRPTPGIYDLIIQIKQMGFQVALLSNTSKYRAKFLESEGGYDLFDPILLSCYLGVRKPNPEIYKKMLKQIRWSAEECLFIDNQPRNVAAAKALGIDGIVFESVDQLIAELESREISIRKTSLGETF